jgi:hypothetical protein
MGQLLDLRLHRGDHLRVAMAGVDHGDAAGEVDVLLALFIDDLGIVGRFRIDREGVSDTARHGGAAPLMQAGIG